MNLSNQVAINTAVLAHAVQVGGITLHTFGNVVPFFVIFVAWIFLWYQWNSVGEFNLCWFVVGAVWLPLTVIGLILTFF